MHGVPTRRGLRRRASGFTLVELLVTIAIFASLVAILLPALRHAIGAARAFRCQVSLRSVAFDFSVFADDQLHGDRGDDKVMLGDRRFRLETFQESQYGIDEFWRWDAANSYSVPDAIGFDPLRCSEVRGPVTLWKNTPCSQGAVTPPENVSYTFNSRLHRAEVVVDGQIAAVPVYLRSEIVDHSMVPLAWDADGRAAAQKDVSPVFSAPSLDSEMVYAGGKYWFPALRHGGRMNVAFVDGHVLATARPLDESGWQWGYQPLPR